MKYGKTIASWAFLGIAAVVTAVLTFLFMHTQVYPVQQQQLNPPAATQPGVPPFVEVGSFYPVSVELTSKIGDVELKHNVSYDLKKQVYTYFYQIKNTSDKTVLFSWEVLDIMTGIPVIVELEPKKVLEHKFERTERPTFFSGETFFYTKEGNVWARVVAEKQIGPLPMMQEGSQAILEEKEEIEPEQTESE
jgi:hypothetical protein